MAKTRASRSRVWVAVCLLAVTLAGCGGGDDPNPEPAPQPLPLPLPGPVSEPVPAPVPFEMKLTDLWQPAAGTCLPDEQRLVQPEQWAQLLSTCRPSSSSTYLRVINISDTTLVFTLIPEATVEYFYPDGESELTKAALGEIQLGGVKLSGGYQADRLELYLPARFSAVITDNGLLRELPTRLEPEHGGLVSHTRAVTDLAGQLPYSKLANLKNTGAKVAACVLESAKKLNDGQVTLEDVIQAAKSCRAMIQELRDWWADQRAQEVRVGKVPRFGLPQTSDDLLRDMSHESRPAQSVLDDIARLVGKWVARAR